MFKGVYNGKQAHAPDLAAVLARAWAAGVERIIVSTMALLGVFALATACALMPPLHLETS